MNQSENPDPSLDSKELATTSVELLKTKPIKVVSKSKLDAACPKPKQSLDSEQGFNWVNRKLKELNSRLRNSKTAKDTLVVKNEINQILKQLSVCQVKFGQLNKSSGQRIIILRKEESVKLRNKDIDTNIKFEKPPLGDSKNELISGSLNLISNDLISFSESYTRNIINPMLIKNYLSVISTNIDVDSIWEGHNE